MIWPFDQNRGKTPWVGEPVPKRGSAVIQRWPHIASNGRKRQSIVRQASLLFKSWVEGNMLPFGDSICVPPASSSSLVSNERRNSLPKWKLLNMQSIKRGSWIEISRSPDVGLHRVALPPPSLPDTNPVFRHHHPLPATPAKIGPNSTTVELNSLKFKWEMSFHWSCKYWKWAGLKIGWMCVVHLNVVKRALPAVSFDQSKTFLLRR